MADEAPALTAGSSHTIVATQPTHHETQNDLLYVWGAGPITKDGPRDRFALVANTKPPLPAGKCRIRTISDDGIRVYRNGQRIIDNWNWHAPKTDVAEFETTENSEHEFRVDYFEIDGHAQLQFFIEQVASTSTTQPDEPMEANR